MLKIDYNVLKVEKFLINQSDLSGGYGRKQYSQLSDHYGLSLEISYSKVSKQNNVTNVNVTKNDNDTLNNKNDIMKGDENSNHQNYEEIENNLNNSQILINDNKSSNRDLEDQSELINENNSNINNHCPDIIIQFNDLNNEPDKDNEYLLNNN